MATNVFGNPVTDETVAAVFPNLTQITARDRAAVALLYRNADERETKANQFVHTLKAAYGTGTSTLCMVFNATGADLTFVLNNTWEGAVWRYPYPQVLKNGQWGGFFHARGRLAGPSKEAIVYRGQNNDGAGRDWMLAWNTSSMNSQNRVYTEIRAPGGFGSVNWNTIDSLMGMQTNNYSTTTLGGFARVSIGAGSSPEFVGIMSLAGLASNYMEMASDVSVVSQSLDSKYVDDVDGADDEAPAE